MVDDKFNGFHPTAMSSLLGRVLRAGGVVVPPGEHIDIVHSGGHWWGCSLVEWLGQMNLTITMEGHQRYALVVSSVSEVADFIDRKRVMSLECEDPTSTSEVPLRVGQCWGIPWIDEELGTTSVYKILSFTDPEAACIGKLPSTYTTPFPAAKRGTSSLMLLGCAGQGATHRARG